MKYHIYEDKRRLAGRPESTLRYVEADSPEAAIVTWMQGQLRHRWRPTSALVIPEDRLYGRPTFLEDPNDRFYVYADPTVDAAEICAENRFAGETMEFYGFQLCGIGWVKREGTVYATMWKNGQAWRWEAGIVGHTRDFRLGGDHGSLSSAAAHSHMRRVLVEAYRQCVETAVRMREMASLLHLTAELCIIVDGRALSWTPSEDGRNWTHPLESDQPVATTIYPFGRGWHWRVEGDEGIVGSAEQELADPLLAEKDWRRWLNKRAGWAEDSPSPFAQAGVLPTQQGGRPVATTEAPEHLPATGGDGDAEEGGAGNAGPEDQDEEEPENTEHCEGCPDKPAVTHDDHGVPLCGDCYDLLDSDPPEEDGESDFAYASSGA